MTSADFLIFYPQFSIIPDVVLNSYTEASNVRFEDFAEDAEEARRLYVAHKLTLYARTMPTSQAGEGISSYSSLASSGDGAKITSKKVDDVAVTYSSGSSSSFASSSSLSDLQETTYGLQLLTLLRLHSYPRYVP